MDQKWSGPGSGPGFLGLSPFNPGPGVDFGSKIGKISDGDSMDPEVPGDDGDFSEELRNSRLFISPEEIYFGMMWMGDHSVGRYS